MGVYISNLRLPSEYQEVEYIQSSGTQFIDTGYLITPTTEVSIDYQYTNASNQDFAFGVGSDTNTSSGMTFCSYIGTTGGVAYFKAGLSDGTGSSTFTNNGPGVDTNRHKFVLNNGHFLTYNSSGTLQKDVTTSATFTRTATHSFGLFCWWRTDTSAWSNKTSAKLYGCKVTDNGVLQRDFVPCYRKSDSVIGLYDLVNNQFYTNSGTGTFSKGSDVNTYRESSLKNAYIGEVWTPGSNTEVYYNIDNSDTSTNIYDKSGNNHTLSGGTFTYTTDSYAGRVYQGGNYSTLPSTNIINFGQSFTFITWVKLTSTASVCSIFANGASASNHPSNAIQVSTVRTYGMASGILNGNLNVSSQANPSTGVWVCIAYTRDSSGNMVIYFNGVSVGTNTVSQSVTYPGNQFVLGGWRSGDKQPLNGYLKELIGETKARTSDQILNYYNTFKSNYGL